MRSKKLIKFNGKIPQAKVGIKTRESTDWKALQEQTDATILSNAESDPLCQPTDALFWKSATREGRFLDDTQYLDEDEDLDDEPPPDFGDDDENHLSR